MKYAWWRVGIRQLIDTSMHPLQKLISLLRIGHRICNDHGGITQWRHNCRVIHGPSTLTMALRPVDSGLSGGEEYILDAWKVLGGELGSPIGRKGGLRGHYGEGQRPRGVRLCTLWYCKPVVEVGREAGGAEDRVGL